MNTKKERRKRQYRLLAVIVIGLLGIIVAGVAMTICGCRAVAEVGRMGSSLAIVVLAWAVIAALHGFVKRSQIVIWGFVAMYVVGLLCYDGVERHPDHCSEEIESGVSVLAPINHTLSIFFPSRGAYNEENSGEIRLSYQVLHLLSYFFFALVVFSFFGRRIMNRSGHRLIPYRHRNLFWGYGENGRVMAESLLKSTVDEQAIFVLSDDIRHDEEEDNRIFNEVNRIDAVALYADYESVSTAKRSFSGHRHLFLTEDQDCNVRMALRVLDSLIMNGVSVKTHLYVRSEIENIDLFFQQKLDAAREQLRQNIEIHIYNHSDLTARLFVSQYPIIKHSALTVDPTTCEVSGEFRILLLGLGWSGLELLRKMICDAQFIGTDYLFSITIIDRDYSTKHGRYKYYLQEFIENKTININPDGISEVNSEVFYDWLANDKRIYTFDRIIVALGDDSLNVNTALELNRFRANFYDGKQFGEKEFIYAQVRDYDKYLYFQQNQSPIRLFGGLRTTNSTTVLIDESMDRIAKMVNYVYSRWDIEQFSETIFGELVTQWEPLEREWAKATLFNQNSSRAVALNISNLVHLAGGETEFSKKLKEVCYLELFAELEHRRWNTFHFVNGIRCWKMEEVDNRKGKLYSGTTLLRHICLIPYNELDAATEKVNSLRAKTEPQEDFKASDRRIIKHFPLFLKHKEPLIN